MKKIGFKSREEHEKRYKGTHCYGIVDPKVSTLKSFEELDFESLW